MKKLALILMFTMILGLVSGCQIEYSEDDTLEFKETETEAENNVIQVAYYNDAYTAYYEYCKESFENYEDNVTINLVLMDQDEYLNTIVADSSAGQNIMDVYMLNNSDIGTAYLAGVALKNTNTDFSTEEYSQKALDACSYGGNLIGYPLGYSTTFLIYNSDIVGDEDISTIADIEEYSTIADFSIDSAANVENVFKSSLLDLYINYGFFGTSFNIGGQYGDDNTILSINNENAIEDVQNYSDLIEYFSIDNSTTYDTCITNFLNGKIVFTIMSTDSILDLTTSEINYQIEEFPDYNDESETSPLSITSSLVVNPYSTQQELSQKFAWYATYAKAVTLYEYAGTLSAKKGMIYDDYKFEDIYESYEKSTPKNKLLYGEQIYPLLEIALHNIVEGEDPEEEFDSVESYMNDQIQ